MPEKGLFKKWKIEKGTNKKALAVDQFYTGKRRIKKNKKHISKAESKNVNIEKLKRKKTLLSE